MALPLNTTAFIVCVDFDDLLKLTLPKNYKHFSKVVVVTTPRDVKTIDFVIDKCRYAEIYTTSVFYKNAMFNKGAALCEAMNNEAALEWVVALDVDIVLPSSLPGDLWDRDTLYVPRRRMLEDVSKLSDELEWQKCPLNTELDFAGYFQMYNAEATPLMGRCAYPKDWIHAGGCDSEFALRWSSRKKVRPAFEVLHLGQPGLNWCGRVTQRASGEVPEEAPLRLEKLLEMQKKRDYRSPRETRYRHEKVDRYE